MGGIVVICFKILIFALRQTSVFCVAKFTDVL